MAGRSRNQVAGAFPVDAQDTMVPSGGPRASCNHNDIFLQVNLFKFRNWKHWSVVYKPSERMDMSFLEQILAWWGDWLLPLPGSSGAVLYLMAVSQPLGLILGVTS